MNELIKKVALEMGFDEVGITSLSNLEEAEQRLQEWIREGRHGSMKYLEDFRSRREKFLRNFPDAKSVIVLGVNYYSSRRRPEEPVLDRPNGDCKKRCHSEAEGRRTAQAALYGRLAARKRVSGGDPSDAPRPQDDTKMTGRIARYAWGRDYHQVIRRKHEALILRLREIFGDGFRAESCVDTKPLPEKHTAARAGLGFLGKNTMLLSQRFGPWLFLSEVVTNIDFEEDRSVLSFPHVLSGNPRLGSPTKTFGDDSESFCGDDSKLQSGDDTQEKGCGPCTRCQVICPTGALDQDYRIDARLCIAYLTIEHKGVIPRELRPKMKDWVFGCDECLTVCPFTSHQKETRWPELGPEAGAGPWLDLDGLFSLSSNRAYEKKYEGTALLRAHRKQMLRNACIVLGNSGEERAIPYLETALRDPSPLVRLHAAWALGRLPFARARRILERRDALEGDPEVREEIAYALACGQAEGTVV